MTSREPTRSSSVRAPSTSSTTSPMASAGWTIVSGPEATPAVLELLAGAGVRATFFLVGEQVERRPSLAARIAAEGHEVGVHCGRHTSLLRMSPGRTRADLLGAAAAIEAATGLPARL